jgi:hypothetical protein
MQYIYMTNLNTEHLLEALDNEGNESIINLNNNKIQKEKNDILQKLQLDRDVLKTLHTKLKKYRVVDNIDEIHYGRYIRWIKLTDPTNIKLTNGGIICDILILDNGVHIRCKNNMNRIFELIMDQCLVFQRITNQEQVILSVMDFLDKK